MNKFKRICCRLYQKILFVAMNFLVWKTPKLLEGAGSQKGIAQILIDNKKQKPLIVTDHAAIERGDLDILFRSFKQTGLAFEVFDKVLPNPTIEQIEQGFKTFKDSGCDSIVAFGGGSVLDCAKIIGARSKRPNKSVEQMKGLLKVGRRLPLFVAVPTTAGTGSEVTVAAVISDPQKQEKYAISDLCLIPDYAVLDAELTVKLPPSLTATTGMDALTHAVEAYIGLSNTAKTRQQARQAVKLIFENIQKAYTDGSDLSARQNMQQAAFCAGQAFTRAYVGYVHAMAHALGGKYGVPHGLANAIILPTMLYAYGKYAYKPLSELADVVGLDGNTQEQKAIAFIEAICQLNQKMQIPTTLPEQYVVQNCEIEALAQHAVDEANPLYPVPYIFDKEEFVALFNEIS